MSPTPGVCVCACVRVCRCVCRCMHCVGALSTQRGLSHTCLPSQITVNNRSVGRGALWVCVCVGVCVCGCVCVSVSQFFKDLPPTSHWPGSCQGYRAGWPSCVGVTGHRLCVCNSSLPLSLRECGGLFTNKAFRSQKAWSCATRVSHRRARAKNARDLPRASCSLPSLIPSLRPFPPRVFRVCFWPDRAHSLRVGGDNWGNFNVYAEATSGCNGGEKPIFIRFLKMNVLFMCLSCILLDLNEISAEA